MAVTKPRVSKVVTPEIKPPPSWADFRRSESQPVQQPAVDWRSKYLSPTFTRQLSQEATGVVQNTPASNKSVFGTSYNSLFKNIAILPGDEWAAEHEYTHAILERTKNTSGKIYSMATPQQSEFYKKAYLGPLPGLMQRVSWDRGALLGERGGELAATVITVAGGQYKNIPRNLRGAFESMFNRATRASAYGNRFDTEGLRLPNYAIALPPVG